MGVIVRVSHNLIEVTESKSLILWLRKLKHKNLKWLTQGQSQNSHLGIFLLYQDQFKNN